MLMGISSPSNLVRDPLERLPTLLPRCPMDSPDRSNIALNGRQMLLMLQLACELSASKQTTVEVVSLLSR